MASTGEFKALADTALFKPLQVGSITLEHRVVLAPQTRMRATKESDGVYVPGDLAVEYYAQRASKGGLLISEATPISRLAAGYPGVPGIFTASQIAAWKKVTDAVKAKGGKMLCQLWHVGRATHPGWLEGAPPVSSTTTPMSGKASDGTEYGDTPPKALTPEEIKELVKEYAAAAKRAIEAGFDGVEIHSANGYLLDQFLHDNVNTRTDSYGGSIENRARFTLEVIESVTAAIGADKTGIRLSPYNYFQDTKDSNPNVHWAYVSEQIATLPIESRPAYVHMVEPRFDEELSAEEKLKSLPGVTHSLTPFKRILEKGNIKFFAAGGYDRENAVQKLDANEADAVVFGRHFIANPDLPKRLAEGLPLNPYDRNSFYGADPPSKGYTDYPFYS